MSRLLVRNSVREALNDAGYFYLDPEINDSIQDGYDEVAAYTGCIESAAAVDFEANLVYYDFLTLIPDFIALVALWNRRTKRWLQPCSDRELDKMAENWETITGEPSYFVPKSHRYAFLHPALPVDSAGDLYVFYKAQADQMSDSSVIQIPEPIAQDILFNYTTGDMFEQAEEWNKATLYGADYKSTLNKLILQISKRDVERLHRLGGNL